MSVPRNPASTGPKKKPKKPPTLLDQLAEATEAQERTSNEPFPPTWNPGDESHPNPITTASFPAPIRPRNAKNPLVEVTHTDGRRFTIWLNNNLTTKLTHARVEIGQPCSIRRSKNLGEPYPDPNTGQMVQAYGWYVQTPWTLANPAGARGAQVLSIGELKALTSGDDTIEVDAVEVEQATVELEPDPLLNDAADDDDEIPF